MKIKLSGLSQEMMDLKKCQIDLLKIAIALFTAISSILIAFYNACNPIIILSEDGSVNYRIIAAFLGLSSIIPLLFPYLSWIIIYKSRSLFRISSYLRLLEHYKVIPEPDNGVDIYDFNYEKLYREMRKDEWLLARFTNNPFINYFYRWLPYSFWEKKYCKKESCEMEVPYKGGFYSRLIRFITYMSTIYFILSLFFASVFINAVIKSPRYSWDSSEVWPFYGFITIAVTYYVYNIVLTFRHNKELLYIPFSQDAQYRMWNRAYIRINGKKKTEHIDDKRRFGRTENEPFPAYYNIHGKSHSGTVLNICDGGFYLKLDSQISENDKIEFTLTPPGKEPQNVSGEVVWMDIEGVGIRYIQ